MRFQSCWAVFDDEGEPMDRLHESRLAAIKYAEDYYGLDWRQIYYRFIMTVGVVFGSYPQLKFGSRLKGD